VSGPRALCLLSGASGFIGGRLSERLLDEGYAVRCLVRPTSDTSRLRQLDVELAVADLGDPAALATAAAGCEFVLHCAALVSDWATTGEAVRANVLGTRNLLAVSGAARRFLHFSTTDVYGHPGTAAVEETRPAASFANWYAHTKRLAEREVRAAAPGAVILRPATVYGPGSADVVGAIARALCNGSMLLVDGGRPIAGLCYVDNLLDAALLALRAEAAAGEAFNVSDGLPVSWRRFTDDLADGLGCRRARFSLPYRAAAAAGVTLEQGYRLLRRATGLTLPPLLSRQAVQVLGRDQDFSAGKARELLGWEPRVSYEDGLAATLGWLRVWLAR
jgi:nucleoside-diphosphate-sugar epimerase